MSTVERPQAFPLGDGNKDKDKQSIERTRNPVVTQSLALSRTAMYITETLSEMKRLRGKKGRVSKRDIDELITAREEAFNHIFDGIVTRE